MKTRTIAVVIPAHDEETLLPGALRAVAVAARHPAVRGIEIRTVVAADSCTDATAAVALRAGAAVVAGTWHNAGLARAAGVAWALGREPGDAATLWIASTDADSRVPPGWLAHQSAQAERGWEAVVGTVAVRRWPGHLGTLAALHRERYEASRPAPGQWWAHPHVHGANLGVAADAYRSVGGFPPVPLGEDQGLVDALDAAGHRVLRTAECPVTTSSRLHARASGGFGDYLARLAAEPGGAGPLV